MTKNSTNLKTMIPYITFSIVIAFHQTYIYKKAGRNNLLLGFLAFILIWPLTTLILLQNFPRTKPNY